MIAMFVPTESIGTT
jgi:hypothetical protein